jgi:hypothetical protein
MMSKKFIPTRNFPIESQGGSAPVSKILKPPQDARLEAVSAMRLELEL